MRLIDIGGSFPGMVSYVIAHASPSSLLPCDYARFKAPAWPGGGAFAELPLELEGTEKLE